MLGSMAIYLLDPDRGHSRRALIRDRVRGELNAKQKTLDVMTHDFQHRIKGVQHRVRSKMQVDNADDTILRERVRAALGHVCSHPRSIHVSVQNGIVQLSGPVMADEAQHVLNSVRMVRGINTVHNLMTTHQSAAEVPEFHGEGVSHGQQSTAPAMGFVTLCCGSVMTLYGIVRRGIVGNLCFLAGAGLCTHAFNMVEGNSGQVAAQATAAKDIPSESVETAGSGI